MTAKAKPRIKPLLSFVPSLTPRFSEPTHLAPLVDLLERVARREEVYACVSTAPRHEKTETVLHGIAWLLKQNPRLRVCYVTYQNDLAVKKSRRARYHAQRARVPLDVKAASAHDWRTGVDEGGLWATSIMGAAVGEGFDLIIIDDPVKDRVAAESALVRDRTYEWFTDTLYPRLEPGGSVIVLMHRWHPDDLAGRLVAEGAEEINLPALGEDGRALCPARYSVERLAVIRERIGEYAWWSLYMGKPRSRGGAVFNGVHIHEETVRPVQYVIGADLAYTAKSSADYSVAVVLAVDAEARFHVVHVERKQVVAPDFAHTLATLRQTYGGATIASYVSGTEKGALDFMARQGVPIYPMAARADKFVRAQLCAAAWNAGKILVPKEAWWLNRFVEELASFTGINDRRDDQIDALVSGYDALSSGMLQWQARQRREERFAHQWTMFQTSRGSIEHERAREALGLPPTLSPWAAMAKAREEPGDEPLNPHLAAELRSGARYRS